MLASTILYVRVLGVLVAVCPAALPLAGPPLATMLSIMAALAAAAWLSARREPADLPVHGNPTELKSALLFTLLFALVLLAVAAAKEYLGQRGLYGVALLSGLTDMDPITLSTAQMVNAGRLEADTCWRLILLASLANLVFKGAMAALLGGSALFRHLAPWFGLALAAGGLLLAAW